MSSRSCGTSWTNGDCEPYYIYGRFVDYLASHNGDDQLWERGYRLFDALAVGGTSLEEILVVGLFETLCVNPTLTERIRKNVGPAAFKLLQDMEAFWKQQPDDGQD